MEAAQLALVSGGPGLVVVEGAVSRITFSNPDTGFAIVRIANEERPVKGTFGRVAVGDSFRIEGTEEQHAKFGRQILATKIVHCAPAGIDGVARYLAELPGIGDVLAQRMVGALGDRAIERLIDDPAAVARKVTGLTKAKAEKAAARAKEKREEQEVLVYLYSIGLSPAFGARVLKAWGAKAPAFIRANPYRLAREISMIGFALADSIAMNLGIAPDAIERREAALLHVLGEAASSGCRYKSAGKETSTGGGHCFLPRGLLGEVAAQLLTVPRAMVDEAVGTLASQGAIVVEGEAVYSASLHRAEFDVAQRIGVLMRNRREPPEPAAAGSTAAKVAEMLSVDQRAAVALVRSAGAVVITGGPGTGKSTTMRAVVEEWEASKRTVVLCAPTGRAAKRLSETTGRIGTTIHRLLEWKGDTGPQKNEHNPIPCDLVIVDEASMLDAPLARALVLAIPQGATLLLVGDVDQLPSVGAGQVLHDIIESGVVPVARLSQIFRQREGSQISAAAAEVLRGEAPRGGGAGSELEIVGVMEEGEESAGQLAQRAIVRLVCEQLPAQGFAPRKVQVLTPMHKGAAGTKELNRALQAALNPNGAELARGGDRPPFRVGDPVLQTKNDYDLGIMNGDLGRIVAIDADPKAPKVVCRFDGAEGDTEHVKDALGNLELAYAMSVHKSQGGEFSAVVMVLLWEHYMMLRRNLLYTGMTRGKKRVVIVGQARALATAARQRDTSTRYTGLKARLGAIDRTPAPGPQRIPETRTVELDGEAFAVDEDGVVSERPTTASPRPSLLPPARTDPIAEARKQLNQLADRLTAPARRRGQP